MSRRLPLGLAAVAALALAGCSTAPSAPPIADPMEILTRSVEAAQAAKTVHFRADVGGSIVLDMTGEGAGGPLDLTGTTLEGDADLAGGALKATFLAPTLLGLSGEVIVIGDDSYLKISLIGDTYRKSSAADSPIGAIGDPKQAIADLRKALDDLPGPPTKAPDEKCGDKDCYRVSIVVPATDVGGMLGGALGGGLGSAAPDLTGTGTVDVWVARDDLRPARLAISADGGSRGRLSATIELTRWDEAVSISAPPAGQVEENPTAP
jgi:hypothetical protein